MNLLTRTGAALVAPWTPGIDILEVPGALAALLAVLFLALPLALQVSLAVLLFFAVSKVLYCHWSGIRDNARSWKKHPKRSLMYSFFTKSGRHMASLAWQRARNLNKDHKWLPFCFSGAAHRLGNYSNDSRLLTFAISIFYMPLAVVGFCEAALQRLIGFFWYHATSFVVGAFLLAANLLSFLMAPFAKIVDEALCRKQYCPHCYHDFPLAEFSCKICGAVHAQLAPGDCGILFARCECNGAFLPASVISGRSRLLASCPSCKGSLAAANTAQFSVQIVGGEKSGKTSFLAAFFWVHLRSVNRMAGIRASGVPAEIFESLENACKTGSCPSGAYSGTQTLSIVYKKGSNPPSDSLVFYDLPGSAIIDSAFEKNPKNFGFCDGIIFLIDPLSIKSVRDECTAEGEHDAVAGSREGDPGEVVYKFLQQFARIRGFSAKKVSSIPVAVVVSKADVAAVGRKLRGGPAGEDCRAYLRSLGLGNALNNIDASFSNVSYFAISAFGRKPAGASYSPVGVAEPMRWIAKSAKSRLANLI